MVELRRRGFRIETVTEYIRHLRGEITRFADGEAYFAIIHGKPDTFRVLNHDEKCELVESGQAYTLISLGRNGRAKKTA